MPQTIIDDSINNHDTSYLFGGTAHLDNLPAYNLHEGVDRLLDSYRSIFESGNYFPLIVPFPQAQSITFAARQQKQGLIAIPRNSLVLGISGYGDDGAGNYIGNFQIRLYDLVSGLDLFTGQWGYSTLDAPPLIGNLPSSPTDTVFGINLLETPFTVLKDNALQITVQNLNTAAASTIIQIALHCVVPYGSVKNNMVITGAR